jgi:hypothetical protein
MRFADELTRFGLAFSPDDRPAVVLAGMSDEIGRLYPLVDAVLRSRLEYRLVLAPPPREVAALRQRYPHEIIAPLPRTANSGMWQRRLGAKVVICRPATIKLAANSTFLDSTTPSLSGALVAMLPQLDPPNNSRATSAFLVDFFAGPPLRSLESLKARLGRPDTILWLGNGPSSEDSSLGAYSGAALFRVNWNWRGRNWMTAPDVVFTADADLPALARRPVIIFRRAAVGLPILRRHTLCFRPPTAGYAFLDTVDPPVTDLSQNQIATNGALMIAVAAALEPARLVIAGVDLYRHAAGRYPGDRRATGGYSREHNLEIDLALIASALDGFSGEVVNLSDNLRAALSNGG